MTRRVDIKFGEDAQTIFVSQGEVKGIPIEDHKVDLVGLADTEFSKRLLAVYLASPEEFPHFRVIIALGPEARCSGSACDRHGQTVWSDHGHGPSRDVLCPGRI